MTAHPSSTDARRVAVHYLAQVVSCHEPQWDGLARLADELRTSPRSLVVWWEVADSTAVVTSYRPDTEDAEPFDTVTNDATDLVEIMVAAIAEERAR